MKTANKKPKVAKTVEPKEAPPRKPEIPQDAVKEFVENKIPSKDKCKIGTIKCTNLWDNRFRINVWMEEHEEGRMVPKIWIGYSYFVHYHDGLIIDKTILPKPKKERIF